MSLMLIVMLLSAFFSIALMLWAALAMLKAGKKCDEEIEGRDQ